LQKGDLIREGYLYYKNKIQRWLFTGALTHILELLRCSLFIFDIRNARLVIL